ncbi:hypothetical protein BCR41DRAFT_107932 [Lobosporangium transversale]|uniref:Uncharacterized protein n=1 Tax=Lobosporangium transversale TaxID=64571 RepID=A0A1Y2GJQ4_9FUNG|nr:hypothetical protein BCR41DRAFT_115240 [Lobosporangium transversale]XP_021879795.1 hypothetical protein BCR41DRAFT_107932 [Lobosporangium transversale]ORZ10997.1 hypothetical protein BCR41DRAFT_115240 [Lobosporangium transversale]ORZ11698.1 hypothetical protein BCR41DRAFT_107932 [Lobosporangium transversale]|eukprot:XP_021879514.1 hypothetical protein BCR41DRAFT_115240 [Lobosporangium transversale]
MSSKEPRLSQVLPIIRCSDCGKDVEFRKLSEHACIAIPTLPAMPLYIPRRLAGPFFLLFLCGQNCIKIGHSFVLHITR